MANQTITERHIMSSSSAQKSILPWIYWGLAAFFFFAEYVVRVSTSVMANDLMREFQVGALALGGISAAFYYAYLGMQIPVGAMVDRYGPRRLLFIATAICAAASLMFSAATGVSQASVARFLFGFGSSFAFVGALKLAATWLPQKYLGTLVGITQGLGMLGASVGEAPMSFAVAQWGWRGSMVKVSFLFAALAIVIGLLIRNKTTNDHNPEIEKCSVIEGFKIVLSNRQTWFNALYAGLIFTPTAAFGELWGVNYLTATTQLNIHTAAAAIGMIFIGWTFGGPLAGAISDRIKRRKPIMYGSAVLCLLVLPGVLYFGNVAQPWQINSLLFLYGLFNGGLVASYTLATEINPKKTAGIALGFTNMASVIIGAALQPVIGAILDLYWDGTIINGVPVYSPASFKLGMTILPISLVLAIICCWFIKETHCQPLEAQQNN